MANEQQSDRGQNNSEKTVHQVLYSYKNTKKLDLQHSQHWEGTKKWIHFGCHLLFHNRAVQLGSDLRWTPNEWQTK